MRPSCDIEVALDSHGAAVWRACCLYFESHEAQDAYQETFLRYAISDMTFADEDHRKAWLVRVAINVCKDMKRASNHAYVSLDPALPQDPVSQDPHVQPASLQSEVVDALRSLPDPPRTPLYLSVCEEYRATEIARMCDVSVNTVYSWIARGKKQLREALS